jgi:putative transposase
VRVRGLLWTSASAAARAAGSVGGAWDDQVSYGGEVSGVTEVLQSYRFALAPNVAQARALASHCGASRVAFNVMLAVVKANLDQRGAERSYGLSADELTPSVGWSAYALRKDWNARKDTVAPWWAENSKEAYAAGCANLSRALGNWSSSKSGARDGKAAGFPRFKSKRRTTPSCTFTTGTIRVDADRRHVTLPVLGTIRTFESTRKLARRLEAGTARIGSATVRFERGRWFVSFVAHVQRDLVRPAHARIGAPVVGVDLGVKDLIVVATPDGREVERVEAPKFLKLARRELRALQRKAARQHGPWDSATSTRREASTGWTRTQADIRALHARVANLRENHLHQTTTRLAQAHDVIGVETLHVAGMLRRPRPKPDAAKPGVFLPNGAASKTGLARSVSDASLGTLVRLIDYKSGWYGSQAIHASRWYPSSKTCSGCGAVKAKLRLSERTFHCEQCGLSIDRDLNAAINLARYADARATTGGSGSLDTGGADSKTTRGAIAPRTACGSETGTLEAQGPPRPQGQAA